MTEVLDATSGFVESFEREPNHARAWVNALRRRGMDAFRAHGFPTTRQEEWRDTNVSVIEKTGFAPAVRRTGQAAIDIGQQFSFGAAAAAELVFINGHFDPHLSTTSGLPAGVSVMNFDQATEREPALLEAHLGKYAEVEKHPFAALNTGFVGEGAFVHIAKGAACRKPIHLVFLTLPGSEAAVSHPRVLIIAEERSESSIVETYAGAGSAEHLTLTNAVTEIILAKGAIIDHNKLQQESETAYHIALMHAKLDPESRFVSHSTSLGSRLTRNDLHVHLAGERAEAAINGLVYARGNQHIDNHTLLFHDKGHCPSHELYKHVLADKSMAVFKGKIFVQKDAQKTDSKQTSKALLLSNEAFMNSQPALEIYADDVKCTHGSTTGPVDDNALFYLISRGLSVPQSRHLMAYAFAADITRRIKVTPVRARIEDFLAAQHGLPQDLRISEDAAHDVALM